VTPRRKVDEALTRNVSPRELGKALDVHFLIRGHVARAPSGGYATELQMIDTATERILGARTLVVSEGTTTLRDPIEMKNALGNLTFLAVKSEADRARGKADTDLDVRDLTFRAFADWGSASREDARASYGAAMALLDRARRQAPDDILAMRLVTEINLCACVNGWSTDIAEQQSIGAAALEDWLRHDPTSITALEFKANLYALRGQYDDAIVIGDAILRREPQNGAARYVKADALLHLGRPLDARAALGDLPERDDDAGTYALAAAIDYTLGRNDLAADEARRAVALMNAEDLRNRTKGGAMLTLIAAEARLGHADRAKAARAKFAENAPGVDTIAEVKAWMQPTAKLVAYEPLFEGLRLAGFSD
jgi:tetratricopeptide (TPR) repeat protein